MQHDVEGKLGILSMWKKILIKRHGLWPGRNNLPRNFFLFVLYYVKEKISVKIHYIVLEKPARNPVCSCPYMFLHRTTALIAHTAGCQRFYHPMVSTCSKSTTHPALEVTSGVFSPVIL